MKSFTIYEIANGYIVAAQTHSLGLAAMEQAAYYVKDLTELSTALTTIAATQKAAYAEAVKQQESYGLQAGAQCGSAAIGTLRRN